MAKKVNQTAQLAAYATAGGAALGISWIGYRLLRDNNLKFPWANDSPKVNDLPNSGVPPSNSNTSHSPVSPSNPIAKIPAVTAEVAFPMHIGDYNMFVYALQMALLQDHRASVKRHIANTGGADGKFGEGLKQALIEGDYISYFDILWYTGIPKRKYDEIMANYASKGNLSGFDPASKKIPPMAILIEDTYLLDPTKISSNKGIPVKAGTTVGYYIQDRNGLAQIRDKNKRIWYVNMRSIRIT